MRDRNGYNEHIRAGQSAGRSALVYSFNLLSPSLRDSIGPVADPVIHL